MRVAAVKILQQVEKGSVEPRALTRKEERVHGLESQQENPQDFPDLLVIKKKSGR